MCERYVISELVPISILDIETGDTYPLQDEGIFETVCDLMNEQDELINEYDGHTPYDVLKRLRGMF